MRKKGFSFTSIENITWFHYLGKQYVYLEKLGIDIPIAFLGTKPKYQTI